MGDVLIKGVGLPKKNDVLWLAVASDGTVEEGYGQIPETKAVEVKPHGRLIDADEHMRVLEQIPKDAVDDVQREAFAMAHMLICQAPTVLEANI